MPRVTGDPGYRPNPSICSQVPPLATSLPPSRASQWPGRSLGVRPQHSAAVPGTQRDRGRQWLVSRLEAKGKVRVASCRCDLSWHSAVGEGKKPGTRANWEHDLHGPAFLDPQLGVGRVQRSRQSCHTIPEVQGATGHLVRVCVCVCVRTRVSMVYAHVRLYVSCVCTQM